LSQRGVKPPSENLNMAKKKLEKRIKQIQNYLANNNTADLVQFIKDSHPVDLGEIFNNLEKEERKKFITFFELEKTASVLPEISPIFRKEILSGIGDVRLAQILELMPSDNAAEILGGFSEKRRKQVLKLIKKEEAEDVSRLLEYKKDTAGRIMTLDFFSLRSEITVAEAIEELRKTDIHSIPYIYVVTDENELIGVLPLKILITTIPSTKLKEIVNKEIIHVTTDVDQEEVANLVRKYNLRAIPVVDKINKLVGIVTVDDILDIVTEEASEDIYHMAGIKEKENGLLRRSIPVVVRLRLPWLIICLVGGMIAAGVVAVFEETLAAIIILAFFMPIIMQTGGNIGTQSSTIVTRGLATGSIDIKDMWKLLWRELLIGLLIGVICGVAIGAIAQIWKGTPDLGIVVGVSMAATVTVAAFLGAFLPLIFHRFGVDPAVASGPAITTLKDITGLLIYFTTATLIML